MDVRKIVAVVEDAEVARTALNWALHNLVRHGDLITLLHVFPYSRTRSKNKLRIRRLKGFQLALSFKDICTNFPNAKIEIVVREGDEDGGTIAAIVREIGASTLVVGLHNRSFLYRIDQAESSMEVLVGVSWLLHIEELLAYDAGAFRHESPPVE
ncbi:hypothetical protein RHSIM_Rhsim08G0138400 [Rhododendron simsii]|uniref:UspA domain-containing protein n=1 Tax=Rhododendron simsii TaxID=118357 RepID=A0A834GSA3_RHOSS|nr:hypothetical protein RHSIM_Rhsim08G0138400 [Rhododendron simsii]